LTDLILEKLMAETEFRSSGFHLIFDSIQDAILVFDMDSIILYVNEAYCRMFRVARKQVIGKKLEAIEPNAMGLDVIRTGIPVRNDYSYIESGQMDVVGDITPLLYQGRRVGAVAVMKASSDLFRINQKLEKLKTSKFDLKEKHNGENILHVSFQKLCGHSTRFLECLSLASKVAPTDMTVLLRGETGVGKEVIAHAIHQASSRRRGPFVPINMASLPEHLIESELFGYMEGAFTGAVKGGKKGKFELADKGTIFLDEIGEMSLNLQVKLLRVIQERAVDRLGAMHPIPINIRILAATNRNLEEMVEQNLFRADLYYRLNVVSIELPSLRERLDDLSFLVETFASQFQEKYQKKILIPEDLINLLKLYPWPGNIRELQNSMEYMVLLSQKSILTREDLPRAIKQWLEKRVIEMSMEQTFNTDRLKGENTTNLKKLTEEIEKNTMMQVLKKCGSKTEAIKQLGISRRSFYEKLKKYSIEDGISQK
jgi:transcriptional regulator with PAS, ATPase and Fis domain